MLFRSSPPARTGTEEPPLPVLAGGDDKAQGIAQGEKLPNQGGEAGAPKVGQDADAHGLALARQQPEGEGLLSTP